MTMKNAIFAGGCFWCMEPPFEKLDGVKEAVSGYTGGHVEDPSYEDICYGATGHYEAVKVVYDPDKITYEELLDVFWKNIDPTDTGGQFADRGSQYKTAVFYNDEYEKEAAEKSKKELNESGIFRDPVVTEIIPAGVFYDAELYHQDYYKKNTGHYERYRVGSGRHGFLCRIWQNKSSEE